MRRTGGRRSGGAGAAPQSPRCERRRAQAESCAGRYHRTHGGEPPAQFVDLLEIATYVFSADQYVRREGPTMPGMGKRWRRSFRLHIPVRSPAFWQTDEIAHLLRETLTFLTDDEFEFVFSRMERHRRTSPTWISTAAAAQRASSRIMYCFSQAGWTRLPAPSSCSPVARSSRSYPIGLPRSSRRGRTNS